MTTGNKDITMATQIENDDAVELGTMKDPKLNNRDGLATKGLTKKPFDTAADPISIALKKLHDDVASEDVPDEFLDLLAEIDRKIAAKAVTPK
jgi:hypothetical protein